MFVDGKEGEEEKLKVGKGGTETERRVQRGGGNKQAYPLSPSLF